MGSGCELAGISRGIEHEIIERDNRASARAAAGARPAADRAFERRVARDRRRASAPAATARCSRFARRFDGVDAAARSVAATRCAPARRACPPDVRRAIRAGGAATSPASRSGRSRSTAISRSRPACPIEQRVEPLARVGCYVPGGRFPLPSSLLMTAVPARVAGVREVIAVCPRPEPAVMAAALEAGVTRLFRIGGAHAIAALAYGTATIPRVDKIVGPGNRYVAAAKALRRRATARSTSTPGRPRSSSSPAPGGRRGSPPTSSRRPSTIPTRGRSSSPGAGALAERVVARPSTRAAAGPRHRRSVARRARRRDRRRAIARTRRWRSPTASRPSIWSSIASR